MAAKAMAHRTSSDTATQKFAVQPMTSRAAIPATVPRIIAWVRREKSLRICFTSRPPAIWAPATTAAARPATP